MKLALALFVVGVLVAPARADERKRIALLEFKGPNAISVRGDVMRLALSKCWVSSASTLDGRSVRDFALDNELDVVVDGTIAKHGNSYEVRVRFLRGTTGRQLTRALAMVPATKLDRAAQRLIERELIRALASVPPRPVGD